MRKHLTLLLLLSLFAIGNLSASIKPLIAERIQNDLLAEYEQKMVLIEKQFADFKKHLDPKKMAEMDVKMKVGDFENSRNSLKAKLRDLRKTKSPVSETIQADLNKEFESLVTNFEAIKKLTD